jgi:hypothetical protein
LRQRLGDDEGHRSPTKRTLSVASEGRVGIFIGVPSRLGTGISVLERAVGAGPRRSNAQHARHGLGLGGVDSLDDAVRHLAAHHHAQAWLGRFNVVGVAAFAAQQGGILLPRHRLADAEFHQIEIVRSHRRVHGRSVGRGWEIRLHHIVSIGLCRQPAMQVSYRGLDRPLGTGTPQGPCQE